MLPSLTLRSILWILGSFTGTTPENGVGGESPRTGESWARPVRVTTTARIAWLTLGAMATTAKAEIDN